MKPRVVILSAFLTPFRSGAEACAEEVALHLADRFDITIVTARLQKNLPTKDRLQGKIPIRRIGFGSSCDKWLFPLLAPFVVRSLQRAPQRGAPTTPLILHAVLETFAGLALHFTKFTAPSAKRLLTLQTMNRSFLKEYIVRSPDLVVAISTALKEIAEKCGREDVTVIPNGVPLRSIEEACQRIQKVPGRILFVGRLERMKGIDTLLRAFKELTEASWEHTSQGFHLRIVGDGSECFSLEHLAQKLHIADRVTFVGAVPPERIFNEFAQAEIFCGLSRSEALGNVFLEAQAAGCAVVAARVGGIPDIVQDGVTGLLVPPDDVHAARGALGRLLRDQPLRRKLAEQGRANASKYDWGVIAEKYGALYDALYETSNRRL